MIIRTTISNLFPFKRTSATTSSFLVGDSVEEENLSDQPLTTRIPFRKILQRGPAESFVRLMRVQTLSSMGDALFTVGLAGTIFFNSDPTQARWRVALYLLLTILPFVLIAPTVGPLMDRLAGGRKWSFFAAAAGRALLCFIIMRDLTSIWFYPEVFMMLILGKVHMISKSAITPTVIEDENELVTANAQLSLFAALSTIPAGGAAILLNMLGAEWTTFAAMIMFAGAAWQITHLPNLAVAQEKPSVEEIAELKGASILLAVKAITVSRIMLGFTIFFTAFHFKSSDRPLWWLAVVGLCAQIGYFSGIIFIPFFKRRLKEAQIITVAMVTMSTVAVLATFLLFSRPVGQASVLVSLGLFAFALGASASSAKLSFDSLVQKDAPDANRGRMFAKFETRFQISWASAALAAALIPFSPTIMFSCVAFVLVVFLLYYLRRRHQIIQIHKTQ